MKKLVPRTNIPWKIGPPDQIFQLRTNFFADQFPVTGLLLVVGTVIVYLSLLMMSLEYLPEFEKGESIIRKWINSTL